MERDYPRFLFCNPTNTKSHGPFVIHTLKPKLIARVVDFNGPMMQCVELWESAIESEVREVLYDMLNWFKNQQRGGHIDTKLVLMKV